MRVLCLASGRGSNFAAILAAIIQKKIPTAELVGLVTNNPAAPAIEIAKRSSIPVVVVDCGLYRTGGKLDRAVYEKELLPKLEALRPDLICLAGYTLLLGREIIERYPDQILNIHPSLLPSFKGLHAQRQALEAGVKWSGCTVHFVNHELDGGTIIEQSVLRIDDHETEDSLSRRLLPIEHETYVKALQKVAKLRC